MIFIRCYGIFHTIPLMPNTSFLSTAQLCRTKCFSKSVAGFAIAERKMEQKKTKDYNYNNTTLFATTGRRKEVESSEVFGGG